MTNFFDDLPSRRRDEIDDNITIQYPYFSVVESAVSA